MRPREWSRADRNDRPRSSWRTEGSDRTTAETSSAEQHAISHRGRAFRALVPVIHDLLLAHP
jgi:hypothetical protein